MPAIWTDVDDRVTSVHYKPNQLSDEKKKGSIIVDSVPDPTDKDGELCYTAASGFHFDTQ